MAIIDLECEDTKIVTAYGSGNDILLVVSVEKGRELAQAMWEHASAALAMQDCVTAAQKAQAKDESFCAKSIERIVALQQRQSGGVKQADTPGVQ